MAVVVVVVVVVACCCCCCWHKQRCTAVLFFWGSGVDVGGVGAVCAMSAAWYSLFRYFSNVVFSKLSTCTSIAEPSLSLAR